MTGEQIKAALHDGRRVYGTLAIANSPQWVAVVEQLGLDLVFIDTEHTPLDRATVAWMCQAYAGRNIAPLVRIPNPDPFQASMVLDGGGAGVIAPYVESADQVRQLAGAVKYRPLKGERLQQGLENPDTLEPQLRDYLANTNRNNFLVVNIESTPAIENLDDILAVEGLDAVLVGPHDLSCSLGIAEQYSDPRFIEAVDTIVAKARARGIGAGIHAFSRELAELERRWIAAGANLIVHSGDVNAVAERLGEDFRQLRDEFEDGSMEPTDSDANI